MGEARRRKLAGRDEWDRDMRAVFDEACGVMEMTVIRPDDFPALLLAGMDGDLRAVRLARAVADTLGRIQSAPDDLPALCACCPRPIRHSGFSLVYLSPARDDVTCAIGLAICFHCGTSSDVIQAKAIEASRKIWPDARIVTVHPGMPGHG